MATGSKRSSADSDLLLCHVGLWRTSRLKFGCASVCEHSEIGFILAIQNIVTPHPSRFARHLLPQSRRRRPRSLARIGQFPAGEGFLSAFSFAHAGAKEKAIKKKTPMGIDTYAKHVCRRRRDGEISRFAKRDHRCRWTTPPFEKGGRKL